MAGIRRLPSGLWQATIRLPDGRRRTRTDPLKGAVKAWALDMEAGIRRGEWADPQDGKITLAQWWDRWSATRTIEKATTKRDASHWRTHVEPRWGSVNLAAITSWDVEAWIADMRRRKVGATTAEQSVRLLRHMLSDAARHRLIKLDPTAGLKIPKPPKHVDRFLSHTEYAALEAQMPTDRDKAMVKLMAFAGLRWEEVGGLHSHRVDLERCEVLVREVLERDGTYREYGKSSAAFRSVRLIPDLVTALRPFVAGEGPVFPGVDYTNWRRRVFVPAVERAGLRRPWPTMHDLRHTFGSWLAAANVAPVHIMALMGHGSLRATERYLHSTSSRFEQLSSALAPVLEPT